MIQTLFLNLQKNYHLSIKFENPDEIKLTVVGNVSKTRIESGEDLVLEVEFRPLLSFRKESVDRRYDICVNIVNGLKYLLEKSLQILHFPFQRTQSFSFPSSFHPQILSSASPRRLLYPTPPSTLQQSQTFSC